MSVRGYCSLTRKGAAARWRSDRNFSSDGALQSAPMAASVQYEPYYQNDAKKEAVKSAEMALSNVQQKGLSVTFEDPPAL